MPTFANGESAASVRTKINDAIDKVDGNAAITSVNIDGGTIDGTTIGGASAAAITGTTITGTSFVTSGDMTFGDNDKAIFGAGSDLQIYHDGSNSYITDTGTGNLEIRGENLFLRNPAGEVYIACYPNNYVSLWYDNAPKLATTATGVDVTGTVTADGLTVDGNITSTGGDLNLATLDLNAIAATKAVTAVDVFVYDTSKDSDGGAWRKRTQHTSWYNETLNTATRGSRREFPAVAVIVAESNKVTIYDGDDPALPMWMVFNVVVSYTGGLITVGNDGTVTALAAANGSITVSTNGTGANQGVNGVFVISFPADRGIKYCASQISTYYDLDIARRNAIGGSGNDYLSGPDLGRLVNNNHNDVAMTVLPDAPIDPATGLPVPTIAVATDGGVSVIKDDGTVVDIVDFYTNTNSIDFYQGGVLFNARNSTGYTGRYAYYPDIPSSDLSHPISGLIILNEFTTPTLNTVGGSKSGPAISLGSDFVVGDKSDTISSGLSFVAYNPTSLAGSMVAYTTSTYNTGWMNGDIKGAFLADTDDTDLVGSGELVTNGTFDTDLTGWTQTSNDASNYWEWSSGTARCVSAGTFVPLSQAALTTGQRYVLTLSVSVTTGGLKIGSTNIAAYNDVAVNINASGTYTFTFTALSDTLYFGRFSGTTDVTIDNVSVKLADADRSVNNKGLIVNGTVTRSAVATGAELVAYSGFSASNYLEQPYNSDLDFGTGDFCVMGWFETTSTSKRIINRQSADNYWNLYVNSTGKVSLDFISGFHLDGTIAVNNGTWTHVAVFRENGIVYLYINGVPDGSVSNAVNLDDLDAVISVGIDFSGVQPFNAGSLALWRISATAPTAEQIKKIYEDEKVLFQENAACTLYGSSDAVTALAHDSDTGLLHVGTSAGRSVFQGLRRVSNTTTAVGTAISASNGLVVEE